MRAAIIFLLLCVSPRVSANAADLPLVFRYGEPVEDYEKGWKGHIERAAWIDDDRIAYQSRDAITCISMKARRVEWVAKDIGKYGEWTVSRDMKRLAILTDGAIRVIDCNSGKTIFSANREQLAKIVGIDFVVPSCIAFTPTGGRLVLYSFSTFYGRNGFVLDPSYKKVVSVFDVDATPREISVSPDGKRVAVIANDDVLCVTDIAANRDVFFRGTRIKVEPKSLTHTVDAPFDSHFRDSGSEYLVYTRDNSWTTGRVFVHNLKTNKEKSFDARNGHIELDVLFSAKRIALTGTSTDLTILDFEGNEVAHKEKAALQRITSVEFSPSGKQILIGSWDGAIYVYEIKEPGK